MSKALKDGWHELEFGAVRILGGLPVRLSTRRRKLPSGAVLTSLARQAENVAGLTFAVGPWRFNERVGEWQAELLP